MQRRGTVNRMNCPQVLPTSGGSGVYRKACCTVNSVSAPRGVPGNETKISHVAWGVAHDAIRYTQRHFRSVGLILPTWIKGLQKECVGRAYKCGRTSGIIQGLCMSERWVVRCPGCGHEFSFAEIDSTVSAHSDPYGIIPKPSGDERKCPECAVETQYEMHNMIYRQAV
jgi:endogenous inhibitor of DNA gyrase (YacG/DUF329 family)